MPDLPPLRLLLVFETVLSRGGFAPAAASLNVTQPAISQSLRQLEEHLGEKLFDRSTRPAQLTRAGKILHAATREGFELMSAAVEDIRRLSAATRYSVTISCTVGVATYWLMPRLAVLSAQMPDIAINVSTVHQGTPALSAGIDLALRFGRGDWQDGEVTPLFAEKVVPVASPALIARFTGAGSVIGNAPLLHVEVEDKSWLNWRVFAAKMGLSLRTGQGPRFTNYVQATQAALNGQGILLGWRSISGDLVTQGRLVALEDLVLETRDDFYLLRARGSHNAEAVAQVEAALLAAARDGGLTEP
jgi:LysR family transcriptional regulator, glycine cleavage system transcriptional activator